MSQLLDLKYFERDGKLFLRSVVWTGQKEVVDIPAPFKPYFFLRQEDEKRALESLPEKLRECAEVEEVDAVTREGERVVKVMMSFPWMVGEARRELEWKGVKTFEADIPYVRRVMIDLGWRVKHPEKIAAFDIEVDASHGFPEPTDPRSRILSISIVGDETIFICEESEEDTIEQFVREGLMKYECLLSWNGAAFDYPFLVQRAKFLGVKLPRLLFQHVDLFGIFFTFFKRDRTSFSLKEVARDILGPEAPLGSLLDFQEPGHITLLAKWARENRERLRFYNEGQARATLMIAKKTSIHTTYFSMCSLAHVLPWHREMKEERIGARKYVPYSTLIDSLVLSRALKQQPRIVFPSSSGSEGEEEEDEKYTGGLVLDPAAGLWTNVVAIDFKAMYPRVIQTFNVSYETWTPTPGPNDIKALHGGFRADREGILPQILAEFEQVRNLAKEITKLYPGDHPFRELWNARQFGVKFLLTSAYGVMGYRYSRLFQVEIAENITSYTRACIMKAIEWVKKQGYRVLYGDTDSLFIWRPEFEKMAPSSVADIVMTELIPQLNSVIRDFVISEYNVPLSRVKLVFDVDRVYQKLKLLTTKKRYYGLVAWEERPLEKPYILVKGLEARRGDWPEYTKWLQRMLIEIELTKSFSDLMTFILKAKEDVLEGRVRPELLAERKHLTKPFEFYKADTPHLRAAKILLDQGVPVRVGDVIRYIFIDGEVIPVTSATKLTRSQLNAWWEKYAAPVIERLEIKREKTLDELFGGEVR